MRAARFRVRVAVRSASAALALSCLLASACGGSAVTSAGTGGSSGSGGGGTAGSAGSASSDTCRTDSDCTWGEIPAELTKASDCTCLYGCGYLPQTTATAQRRALQHQQLCNPQKDGKGQPCGIDDCALPGPLSCAAGSCKPAQQADAGPTQ